MLAFIVGLRAEARMLNGHVFIGGGDAAGARRASAQAIGAGATALISFGLAGGLDPAARPGTLIIPQSVIWSGQTFTVDAALACALGAPLGVFLGSDTVVVDEAEKARLWRDTGAHAVDLESGAVAQAASGAGIPFAVLRAVCDPAERTLPPAALAALDAAGAIGLLRVLASLARQPAQLRALLMLARDAARARQALTTHIAGLRASGTFAAWE